MVARGDATSRRMAVARYYYSINHALRAEPYLSQEPDRRLYLEGELGRYQSRGESSTRRAARAAIDGFLNRLRDLRKHADYDPAGRSAPGDEAVDFAAKSQYMAEIAQSVLHEVTAYTDDIRRDRERSETNAGSHSQS